MNNYVKYEVKRCFFSKINLMAMIMVMVSLLIPYVSDCKFPYPNSDGIIFFIRSNIYLLPLLAPIICCLPSSTKYIEDETSGISKFLFIKIKRKDYLKVRLIVNAMVSAFTIVIPQIIMLSFLILRHGINGTEIEVVGAFHEVFFISKIGYIGIVLLVTMLSSIVFSTFSMGLSKVVKNKYLTIIVPFVYVLISGTIFYVFGINDIFNLNVSILFDISYNLYLTIANLLIYEAILLFIGISLFCFWGEKNSEE